uniref:Transcription regulator protein BACH1 n=1 Tax=Geotrypetes seraphini TaxID=260995 RepID=A0A6P8QPL8_GEOSA|nr:transcription regulator protein BACH1 [Geotrypetes seraphini]XP_033797811.1 transcription regulator protein BACH1 [Geotrypetes seraphini]XP_033797812.1 transcription regulator protein BACH1 [Geotrypetes seraphini]
MSGSERNNVVFAYESSVHSINVLLSLNDQRKQDLLCDVTVLVEDQRFRAHRCVLAACSDYFLTRIVNQHDADLVITLPEEVTVKGFTPLLQFAYTSKLLLNKDNVSEVSKCAEILAVHNIEASCFQFLKFKFSEIENQQQDCPRKKCCKSFCEKVSQKISCVDPGDLEIDEVEEFLVNEHLDIPCSKFHRCQSDEVSAHFQDGASQGCEAFCLEKHNTAGFSSLCPKYRKFQKAFKSGQICSLGATSSSQDVQSMSGQSLDNSVFQKSQESTDTKKKSRCEPDSVEMQKITGTEDLESETDALYPSALCSIEQADDLTLSSNSDVGRHGFNSVPFPSSYEPCGLHNSEPGLAERSSADTGNGHEIHKENLSPQQAPENLSPQQAPAPASGMEEENNLSLTNLSTVEREVAEHLAKGFWNEIYNTETTCQAPLSPAARVCAEQINSEKKSECPWLGMRIGESPERTFTTLSSVQCPFINTLATEGCSNSSDLSSGDYVKEKQQEKCLYSCVVTLGEESETDTEGDSESCSTKEQECEVKLPFNTQRIISLSRNDFQSLLKMYKLTPEQLDYVHDIRRRSKNRIAAQRCRKRKLDCIQNLESEIEKLQHEKNNLLKERNHILSTLGETKQNLMGLCQQVCREAALSQEQIQILAKHSSSECPLSFLIPEKDQPPQSECEAIVYSALPDGFCCLPAVTEQCVSACEGSMFGPTNCRIPEVTQFPTRVSEKALIAEHCAPSGMIDFCQQMTDKCTTDE